jgi:hypothetical protein
MDSWLLMLCLVAVPWLPVTYGQTTYFDNVEISGIGSGENFVYMLLLIFFGVNFFTPLLYWLLRNYIQKWLDKAQYRLMEIQQRISERMSDASRKFSDKVRT